jgi:hypothetical protein
MWHIQGEENTYIVMEDLAIGARIILIWRYIYIYIYDGKM